ncbi:MAG TPA: hypothetical protein VK573_08465 [Gemmatimonadales bacterium]|nr:hypothetical protein [Gemmatimonadales bacterium]
MGLTRSFCSALTGAMLLGTPLSAQRRTDLPPPESSRPPLLTQMPSDSIRYHTAWLRLTELLQLLQTGDAARLGRLFENAAFTPPTCGTIGDAFARLAARVRQIEGSDGATSRLVFFDKVKIVDSATTQVATAELILVPKTSSIPMRDSVTLVLDPGRAAWTREAGLLEAFCGL